MSVALTPFGRAALLVALTSIIALALVRRSSAASRARRTRARHDAARERARRLLADRAEDRAITHATARRQGGCIHVWS